MTEGEGWRGGGGEKGCVGRRAWEEQRDGRGSNAQTGRGVGASGHAAAAGRSTAPPAPPPAAAQAACASSEQPPGRWKTGTAAAGCSHACTHKHAHESIHAPRRSANCASFVMASASSRITSFTPVEKSLRVPAGQEGWRGAWRLEGESSRGVDALPVAAQGLACFAALAQPPPGRRRRRSTLPPPHTPARGTRQRMT